jgi:hypothetical protein
MHGYLLALNLNRETHEQFYYGSGAPLLQVPPGPEQVIALHLHLQLADHQLKARELYAVEGVDARSRRSRL